MMRPRKTVFLLPLVVGMLACTPTVQVAAPTEPIEINVNVKIEHEIRVQVDEDLDDLLAEDSDIF